MPTAPARIAQVRPPWAVQGGHVTLEGQFHVDGGALPRVRVGERDARLVRASPRTLVVLVPDDVPGGRLAVRVDDAPAADVSVVIGAPLATGLHQVDNPVFGRDGQLYVTYSGARGQQAPVSIYRVRRDGAREPFVSGITNATALAFGPDDRLYVSSRFEGMVYRVLPDGTLETVATELGVACGLAFDADGTLFVGDRSGTVFRVDAAGRATAFASLPSSVAAYHLAIGPDRCLYVTAPTLASRDPVYRIDRQGQAHVFFDGFGRPQGLAFDANGDLYVVEALAGACGLYRLRGSAAPEYVLAAPALVGLAFDPAGGLVVSSNETAYRLDVPLQALALAR